MSECTLIIITERDVSVSVAAVASRRHIKEMINKLQSFNGTTKTVPLTLYVKAEVKYSRVAEGGDSSVMTA